MKIIYNEKIVNDINRDVESIKGMLTSVIDKVQNINIPADFNRKNDIYYTQSTLASAKLSLISYSLWLEKVNMNYNNVEEECMAKLNQIKNVTISKKDNIL